MNKLDTYMNDPEIINEPLPLREVHAIRLMIHDDTKGMQPDEVRAYYKKGLDEAQAKYGFKIVKDAK